MTTIYRGDNTSAFGAEFLEINVENSNLFFISKAEFRCGEILKTFEKPVFPLKINLDENETEKLKTQNTCYLAVYDEEGRKKTCAGSISFASRSKVV